MVTRLARAMTIALPISLLLWAAVALASVSMVDHYRPGFRHALKGKIKKAAAFQSWTD